MSRSKYQDDAERGGGGCQCDRSHLVRVVGGNEFSLYTPLLPTPSSYQQHFNTNRNPDENRPDSDNKKSAVTGKECVKRTEEKCVNCTNTGHSIWRPCSLRLPQGSLCCSKAGGGGGGHKLAKILNICFFYSCPLLYIHLMKFTSYLYFEIKIGASASFLFHACAEREPSGKKGGGGRR